MERGEDIKDKQRILARKRSNAARKGDTERIYKM